MKPSVLAARNAMILRSGNGSTAGRNDRRDDRRVPLTLVGEVGSAHPDDRGPAIVPFRDQRPQVVVGRIARERRERPLAGGAPLAAKQLVVPLPVAAADQ